MKELIHYFIEFLLIICSLFVFYKLKNFYPKYFEAKATNQATKEDIGEITEIIETIKSDISQQNEFLKAQLSLSNQHKLNIKSAEREAIFEFNKQKSVWIYSLIRFSFYKYDQNNFREIDRDNQLGYQERQYNCDIATAHIVLFMHDNEFLDLKEKLINEIILLHKIIIDTIYSIYHPFIKAEINFREYPADEENIRYVRNEELITIEKKHREEKMMQFEKVNALDVQMRELLFSRLKILEDTTTANSQ